MESLEFPEDFEGAHFRESADAATNDDDDDDETGDDADAGDTFAVEDGNELIHNFMSGTDDDNDEEGTVGTVDDNADVDVHADEPCIGDCDDDVYGFEHKHEVIVGDDAYDQESEDEIGASLTAGLLGGDEATTASKVSGGDGDDKEPIDSDWIEEEIVDEEDQEVVPGEEEE